MAARARLLLVVALLTLGAAMTSAHAAAFLVPLGQTRVALDVPPGFVDTGFLGSPRIEQLAQALTPASNRILSFAISDADLRAFMNGDQPELRRYMLVVTPRSMVRRSLSLDEFAAFASTAIRSLGKRLAGHDYPKLLDGRPPGHPSVLADLRNTPEVVSVLQGARLPQQPDSEQAAHYLLSTTTLVLLRGKPLVLSVYTAYDGPDDLSWLKFTTAHWVEALQRLNRR